MTAIHRSREAAELVTGRLRLLAQPQRLMILSFLASGEHTVGEIDEATAIGQPLLSQQLAQLRRSGLVTMRRDARQVFYRHGNPGVTHCVAYLEEWLDGNEVPAPRARAALSRAAAKPAGATARTPSPINRGAAGFAQIVTSAHQRAPLWLEEP